MRFLILFLAVLPAAALASDNPRIDYVEPYRLKVTSAGTVDVDLHGDYPGSTEGHPDRSQWEHWTVRRIDRGGAWTACGITAGPCRMNGWTRGMQTLRLSAELLNTPGLLELQVQEGLTEPFAASNILRMPVLEAFGAPPVIVSVDKTKFPVSGKDDDYVFRIAANNFDDSVRVVFGESNQYAIAPRRVYDGTTIEVAVPKEFRATAHEARVSLRTDRGGLSAPKMITIAAADAPKVIAMAPMTPRPQVRRINPAVIAAAGASAQVSPDVALANRVREALVAKLGADAANALTISAKDGWVAISGGASADRQREIVGIATNVAGVKSVRWGA
jgi:osmotically-inducible protein OsmY